MLPNFKLLRQKMVQEQLIGKGIKDQRVLYVFREIERHLFVPEHKKEYAYDDCPLPIGFGQTISQPYIVAFMTEALKLKGSEKVLEIGTGSGYQTAILAELAGKVYTVERAEKLSQIAYVLLAKMRYKSVEFKIDDGSLGWQEESPFDRIIVTAALPDMPTTLMSQLKENGLMLAPVGDAKEQILYSIRRDGKSVKKEALIKCVFVKLVGKEGWKE